MKKRIKRLKTEDTESDSFIFFDKCIKALRDNKIGNIIYEKFAEKTPAIDLRATLYDENNESMGLTFSVQLKGTEKNNFNLKFPCDEKFLNHCRQTNDIVILILVDLKNNIAYWENINHEYLKKLNNKKTVTFSKDKIVSEDNFDYFVQWKEICKKDWVKKNKESMSDILQLSDPFLINSKNLKKNNKIIEKIIENVEKNIYLFPLIIYLLSFYEIKNNINKFKIREFLNITKFHENYIIDELIKNKILITKNDLIYIVDDNYGKQLCIALIGNKELSIFNLYKYLRDIETKRRFLDRLNKTLPKNRDYAFFYEIINVLESSIDRSKKNETILRNLQLIELFIYRTPSKSIRILNKIIKTKSPIPTKPIMLKGYGTIDVNVSHTDLIEKSIELLVKIRYIETKKVFNVLLRLVIYKDSKIQSLALQAIRDITTYDIFVIEKIGFKPQEFLIKEIINWKKNKVKKYFDLIIDVCGQLLSPSFQGTSQKDPDTIVWHNGALPISNELKEIRQKTINLLFKMYSNSDDVTHKLKLINTLEDAMRYPSMGKYGDDMVQMIDENTSEIIDFYSTIVSNSDNEIIKNIEEQLYWVNQKYVKQISNVSKLQKIIDEKEEYQIYRVLVGYDFRYSGSKEIEDVEKERLKIIQDYIKEINEDNLSDWKKIVEVQILKYYEKLSELVGYNYFRIFLEQFGARKPELAYKFLTQSEDILRPFLGSILQGIWQGNKTLYKQIFNNWKKKNKNLDVCAGMYAHTKKINAEDLEDIYKKAKKNLNVFSNILWSISNNEIKNNKFNELFLNCIEVLSKNDNYYWLQYPWYKDKSILKTLSIKDLERMLNILKNKPFIDYDTETLLMPVLEKDPKMFFNFLFERVKIYIEKREKQEKYDAIPMNFHQLNKLLNTNIVVTFQELLPWFEKEHYLFNWEASRLLAENYSLQNKKFIEMLIKYIKSNDLVKAKAVIRIFNDFRGNQKIFDLAKIFVHYWYEDNKLMIDLQGSLMATGVITGEYGFVEAYKKKQVLIREWKKDNNPNIKKFASKFDKYLSKQIIYEKKRADDDIALKKRAFE